MYDVKSGELENCRAFEKWAHWILLQHYPIDSISEKEEPLLYMYLLKAQQLEKRYENGYSSSVLEYMHEGESVESLACKHVLKEQHLSTPKSNVIRLNFPFDQVSEGFFLGYLMEVLMKQELGTYVSLLKKDVSYEIQMVHNLSVLLQVLREEGYLDDIEYPDITPDNIITSIGAVNDLFSILFRKFILQTELIRWNNHIGEAALLHWCQDRSVNFPTIDNDPSDFDRWFYNGILFCYIVHSYFPEHINLDIVTAHDPQTNLKHAFDVAYKQVQVPYLIHNFNINKITILLYLSTLFQRVVNLRTSTFESRAVSSAILRKVVFSQFYQQYSSDALQVLRDIRSYTSRLREDISEIEYNNCLEERFQQYKEEKMKTLFLINDLFKYDFNLKLLDNDLELYTPPNDTSPSHLIEAFNALSHSEFSYISNNNYKRSKEETICFLESLYNTKSKMIQVYIEMLTTHNFDVRNKQTLIQHLFEQHDTIISLTVFLAQIKGQYYNLKLIRDKLIDLGKESSSIVLLPVAFEELKKGLMHRQNALEDNMSKLTPCQVLKSEYESVATELSLVLAHYTLLLSSKIIEDDCFDRIDACIVQFLEGKGREKMAFVFRTERQLRNLGEQMEHIASASDLEQFVNDVQSMKAMKEKEVLTFSIKKKKVAEYNELCDQLLEVMLNIAENIPFASPEDGMLAEFLASISSHHQNTVQMDQQFNRVCQIAQQMEESWLGTTYNFDTFKNKWFTFRNYMGEMPSLLENKINMMRNEKQLLEVLNEKIKSTDNLLSSVTIQLLPNAKESVVHQLCYSFDELVESFMRCIGLLSSWQIGSEAISFLSRFKHLFERALVCSQKFCKEEQLKERSGMDTLPECNTRVQNKTAFMRALGQIFDLSIVFDDQSVMRKTLADFGTHELQSLLKTLIRRSEDGWVVSMTTDSIQALEERLSSLTQKTKELKNEMEVESMDLDKLLTLSSRLQVHSSYFSVLSKVPTHSMEHICSTYITDLRCFIDNLYQEVRCRLGQPLQESKDHSSSTYYSQYIAILQDINDLREYHNLEELQKQKMRIDSRLKDIDEFKVGSTLENLSQIAEHASTLFCKKNNIESEQPKPKNTLEGWIQYQITFLDDWCSKIEKLENSIQGVDSIDTLNSSKIQVDYAIQETLFIENIVRDLEEKKKLLENTTPQNDGLACSVRTASQAYTHSKSRLKRLRDMLLEVEESYMTRIEYEHKLLFEVQRLHTFLNLLQKKNICRKTNFYGRTPISLLTSNLEDLISIKNYVETVKQISKQEFAISLWRLIQLVDERINSLNHNFKELTNQFEQLYNIVATSLANNLAIERELYSLSAKYDELASQIFKQLESGCYDTPSPMSKLLEQLRVLDEKIDGRALQIIPYDLLLLKWNRVKQQEVIYSGTFQDISIEEKTRENQLKTQIMETADELSLWMSHMTTIETCLNQLSTDMDQTKKLLEAVNIMQKQEMAQYNKLISLVGMHIELSLITLRNNKLNEIVERIELDWIQWLKMKISYTRLIRSRLEELLLNEEKRTRIIGLESLKLEIWIDECYKELQTIIRSNILTKTQVNINKENLRLLKQQKEVMDGIYEGMRNIYDQIDDPELQINTFQQHIVPRWSKLSKEFELKELLLTELDNQLRNRTEEKDLIDNNLIELLKWISLTKKLLINNLNSGSSQQLRDCVDRIDHDIRDWVSGLMLRIRESYPHDVMQKLLENHWKALLFLFDRFKREATHRERQEELLREQRAAFQSKCAKRRNELEILSGKILAGNTEVSTSEEAEKMLDQLFEVYSEVIRILSTFVTQAQSYGHSGSSFSVEEALVETFLITLSTLQEKYDLVARQYDYLKKSESLSAAYSIILTILSNWEQEQRAFLVESGESVGSVLSAVFAIRRYSSQRRLISSVYKHVSALWAKLTSMGIVLNRELATPHDIKNKIEKIDCLIRKKGTRSHALLEQYDYTRAVREQWLNSAFHIIMWIRKDLNSLCCTNIESFPPDALHKLKEKLLDANAKLNYLLELRTCIIQRQDHLVLIDGNCFLTVIIEMLHYDQKLVLALITEVERKQRLSGPDQMEARSKISSILQIRASELDQLEDDIMGTNNPDIQSNLLEKYTIQASSIVELLDLLQEGYLDSSETTLVISCFERYLNMSKCLRSREQVPVVPRSTMLSGEEIGNIDLFLEKLFLVHWIAISTANLEALIDRIVNERDFWAKIQQDLIHFNILQMEMKNNRCIMARLSVAFADKDLHTLEYDWQSLENLLRRLQDKIVNRVLREWSIMLDTSAPPEYPTEEVLKSETYAKYLTLSDCSTNNPQPWCDVNEKNRSLNELMSQTLELLLQEVSDLWEYSNSLFMEGHDGTTTIETIQTVYFQNIAPKVNDLKNISFSCEGFAVIIVRSIERFSSSLERCITDVLQLRDARSAKHELLVSLCDKYRSSVQEVLTNLDQIQSDYHKLLTDNSDDATTLDLADIVCRLNTNIGKKSVTQVASAGCYSDNRYMLLQSLRTSTLGLGDKMLNILSTFFEISKLNVDVQLNLSLSPNPIKIVTKWRSIISMIERSIYEFVSEMEVKPIDLEYCELLNWYNSASKKIQHIPFIGSYYDAQMALQEINILTNEAKVFEKRYHSISGLVPSKMQVLNEAREAYNVSILNYSANVSNLLSSHLSFEKKLQLYAMKAEELDSFMSMLHIEFQAVRDEFSQLQNNLVNTMPFNRKQTVGFTLKNLLQCLKKRAEYCLPMLDECSHLFDEIREIDLSAICFTELTPVALKDKYSVVVRCIDKLGSHIDANLQSYDQHSQFAIEYVKRLNRTFLWLETSETIISYDMPTISSSYSVRMLQRHLELCQELSCECSEMEKVLESLSLLEKTTMERFHQDYDQTSISEEFIDMFGLINLDMLHKKWSQVLPQLTRRKEKLQTDILALRNIQCQYGLPSEVITLVQKVFDYFAKNNKTVDQRCQVTVDRIAPLLKTLGVELGKELEEQLDAKNTSSIWLFDNLIQFLNQSEVIPKQITCSHDMKRVLCCMNPIKSWKDLKYSVGSSLSRKELKALKCQIVRLSPGCDMKESLPLDLLCDWTFSPPSPNNKR